MLALNHGRRDVCDGTTPLLHHRCAQPLGVPLPGIRLLDDLVRNHIIGDIVAIKKPKRRRKTRRTTRTNRATMTMRHNRAGDFADEKKIRVNFRNRARGCRRRIHGVSPRGL